MSKAPRLPSVEQEQAKEPSPQVISHPQSPGVNTFNSELEGSSLDELYTGSGYKETIRHSPAPRLVPVSQNDQLVAGAKQVTISGPPSMNFNAASPTLNTDLPPAPQFVPPKLPSAIPKQFSAGGHNDEFRSNELLAERYQITKKIGQGGMGQVFAALDQRLNREVVVKVAHSGGEGPSLEDRARFEREALKMASLNHPNIVTIYDCGEHEGDQFLVMELIKGETLKSFVNRPDSLSPSLFKEIITQLLRGVQEAHDHDVIHRDLKPSNLMWDEQRKILKILDFGLARGVEGDTVTGTGHVHGSIQYMAPEQIRGEPQGPATDLYAVGILCFQLISKTLPFRGENTVELMFQKLQKNPYELLEQDKTPNWVTPALANVIRGCLSLQPSERPLSARDCLDQMLACLPNFKAPNVEGTNPLKFDGSSEAQSLPANDLLKATSWNSSIKENTKPLLISALLGGALLQLIASLFVSADLDKENINLDLRKTASVYFTSIDQANNSESQVTLAVNGEEKGLTPLQLQLRPGKHEVTLTQGEWRFSKSYKLKGGETYWYALPAPPELKFELPTPVSTDRKSVNVKSEEASTKRAQSPTKRKRTRRKTRRTNKANKKTKRRIKESRRKKKIRSKTRSTEPTKTRSPKKLEPKKSTPIDVPLLELE